MRLTIVSKIASVLLLGDLAKGQSLLAKRFNISGPVYEYDGLEFTMDFEVSDFMQDSMVSYSLYDGLNCKDGNDNDITENDGYLLSRIRSDSTPLGDGMGTRTIKVQTELNPSGISNSPLYREDEEGNAVVEYCVRFSVYNRPANEDFAMESNYIESPVKLVINLNAGFTVDTELSNADTVLASAQQDTAVEAYICDNDENIVPILPTQQGQTIRVCVSPIPEILAIGALISQLEEFTFRRESPVKIEQVAIAPNTGGVAADQLTIVSCRPGSTVCAFETLLSSDFFSGEGYVVGTGTAFLQLGTGQVAQSRRLEGTPNQILSERPTRYSVILNLVPVEADINLAITSGGTPASVAFTGVAILVTFLSALF